MKTTLQHEGNNVREFYCQLPRPVRVGIEATGSLQWVVNLMEELRIECLVGHPATIRAAEPRKQKHDRRDANLLWIMLRDHIDYNEFCRREQMRQKNGDACAGMPALHYGAKVTG